MNRVQNINWHQPEVEQTVIQEIKKSPDNLRKAFDNIAAVLGCSASAVSNKWYQHGLKQKLSYIFSVNSTDVSHSNSKNAPRKTTNPVHEKIMSRKLVDGVLIENIRRITIQ
jgi:hypothetical protein